MIRNSTANDLHNAQIHRDMMINRDMLHEFRIISVIKGFGVPCAPRVVILLGIVPILRTYEWDWGRL
jgi:hypothetical protein